MTIFIESEQLKQMLSYKPLAENHAGQQKIKLQLLESIKEFFADKFYRLKKATREAIDFIAWLSSERGFIFASQLYLAERHGITDRTIRNIMKQLEGAGLVVKVHRRAKGTNAKGKPVYLFTKHKYFSYWKELLNLSECEDFHEDFHEENKETPYYKRAEEDKKNSTNTYLNKLRDLIINKKVLSADQKKASEMIKSNKLIFSEWKDHAEVCAASLPKKMKTRDWEAFFEVLESMKNNVARYGNPMKYFETCFSNAVKKVNSRAKLKAFEEFLNSGYEEISIKPVPFYNWLEE
ncbi:hypothetical protein [Bacillus badius]|uniref:Helix-turn-helix domain-containing protein n=1 Tax=Bacillus badius TaxID=1455 RepID=A0ABR5ANL7_BACBA|nr:hypothetical protein [Bacillus badius]KIL72273.1 hypothetical protein SD77_3513 [Bacillus badius]KZN99241.1 hypothetical protein A4244_19455 [Bacillus badius]KZR57851.1 hypothetical protein A3781_19475 [Bacillus badius]MED0668482.1 hypothetical protein [Bacillus badius]MED4717541.1 hypothetical protein [Bacillus badius]